MTSPGLALVGLMPPDFALHYLSQECEPTNSHPEALYAEWQAACDLIQGPLPNVGRPEILDIPESHQGYIEALKQCDLRRETFEGDPNLRVAFIEAAPILAYQFQVLEAPAIAHGSGLGCPPTLEELCATFLPMENRGEQFYQNATPNCVMIETRALNLRPTLAADPTRPGTFVFSVGVALPFVHVVRFQERCFLYNGYHRTYAALSRGATHVPCVIRDVKDISEVGLNAGTFAPAAFDSDNPPCMHKFATGQAQPVQLKVKTRTVQLTMTDWVTPEI